MKTVIEMAREVWSAGGVYVGPPEKSLAQFAELVRADEREQAKLDVHSCGPTCANAACVAVRDAVLSERESCAKVCDAAIVGLISYFEIDERIKECADAIRARGQQ